MHSRLLSLVECCPGDQKIYKLRYPTLPLYGSPLKLTMPVTDLGPNARLRNHGCSKATSFRQRALKSHLGSKVVTTDHRDSSRLWVHHLECMFGKISDPSQDRSPSPWNMALSFTVSLLLLLYVFQVSSWRLEPTEPFPPPLSLHNHPEMTKVFDELQAKFQYAAQSDSSTWRTNITSFSLAVTSASETLWTSSYTAPILGNYTDSRPSDVTDKTYFRIASISKVFTVLAVLIKHQAKDWSLHDPITKYVPELLQDSSGDIVDWESITLETLAGQLSGIPRECQHVCLAHTELLLTGGLRWSKWYDRPCGRPPIRLRGSRWGRTTSSK